jgi:hypothetical protein
MPRGIHAARHPEWRTTAKNRLRTKWRFRELPQPLNARSIRGLAKVGDLPDSNITHKFPGRGLRTGFQAGPRRSTRRLSWRSIVACETRSSGIY